MLVGYSAPLNFKYLQLINYSLKIRFYVSKIHIYFDKYSAAEYKTKNVCCHLSIVIQKSKTLKKIITIANCEKNKFWLATSNDIKLYYNNIFKKATWDFSISIKLIIKLYKYKGW